MAIRSSPKHNFPTHVVADLWADGSMGKLTCGCVLVGIDRYATRDFPEQYLCDIEWCGTECEYRNYPQRVFHWSHPVTPVDSMTELLTRRFRD